MRLYHFCNERDVKSIMGTGLKLGKLVVPSYSNLAGFVIYDDWQWLTLDPDPKAQTWATKNLIGYSRTQWRLTVEIPKKYEKRLFDREGIRAQHRRADELFRKFEGCENWRVYHGQIPKSWIVAAEKVE